MSQNRQDLEALLGPSGRSDYIVGDVVKYRSGDGIRQGEIIHITEPGKTPVSGTPHPTEYWIDGFTVIYQTDILQEP